MPKKAKRSMKEILTHIELTGYLCDTDREQVIVWLNELQERREVMAKAYAALSDLKAQMVLWENADENT